MSTIYGQKGVDDGSNWRGVRGRPILAWIDGVKAAFGNRGMMVEAYSSMRKRSERVENQSTNVTE